MQRSVCLYFANRPLPAAADVGTEASRTRDDITATTTEGSTTTVNTLLSASTTLEPANSTDLESTTTSPVLNSETTTMTITEAESTSTSSMETMSTNAGGMCWKKQMLCPTSSGTDEETIIHAEKSTSGSSTSTETESPECVGK
jgi:hypothetical protein